MIISDYVFCTQITNHSEAIGLLPKVLENVPSFAVNQWSQLKKKIMFRLFQCFKLKLRIPQFTKTIFVPRKSPNENNSKQITRIIPSSTHSLLVQNKYSSGHFLFSGCIFPRSISEGDLVISSHQVVSFFLPPSVSTYLLYVSVYLSIPDFEET